jgi:hypothetical protein
MSDGFIFNILYVGEMDFVYSNFRFLQIITADNKPKFF